MIRSFIILALREISTMTYIFEKRLFKSFLATQPNISFVNFLIDIKLPENDVRQLYSPHQQGY